jgi:hypothetical protein
VPDLDVSEEVFPEPAPAESPEGGAQAEQTDGAPAEPEGDGEQQPSESEKS